MKEGSDLINMNADWDSFGTEMASLYEPVRFETLCNDQLNVDTVLDQTREHQR